MIKFEELQVLFNSCKTLEELLDAMNFRPNRSGFKNMELNYIELPSFEGAKPPQEEGFAIWAWDNNRMIIGDWDHGFKIVPREDRGVTEYECMFNFENETRFVSSRSGIDAFRYGFWLDEDGNYSMNAGCLYWIPPTAIVYIKKIKKR